MSGWKSFYVQMEVLDGANICSFSRVLQVATSLFDSWPLEAFIEKGSSGMIAQELQKGNYHQERTPARIFY